MAILYLAGIFVCRHCLDLGDRDPGTEDLSVWLLRAQSDGQHIGPGDGNEHVQIVDVKDVARFLVLAVDQSIYGTFNLTGRR